MRDAPYTYIKAGTWTLLLTLLCALPALPPALAAAQAEPPRLLSDLDIPLMEGFQEEEDSRVVFDTPEGRIIEVRAHGPDEPRAVYDYYRLVLSGLSWRMTGQASGPAAKKAACAGEAALCIIARRDRERLTIKISRIEKKDSGRNNDQAKGGAKTAAGVTVIDFLLDPL